MIKSRLKKLKIIVFDLDGTLLSDDGTVGENTLKLVPELKKLGVKFSIASGRLHSAVIAFAEQLQLESPLISLDGSLIKSHFTNTVLFESFVKDKYVLKAIDFADKFLINIALCHADAIYFTDRNSAVPQILDRYGARFEEVDSLDDYCDKTLEIVFAGDNRNSINFVSNRLRFPYAFGLNTALFKSQKQSGIYYFEIRKKGSSKGTGFLRLLKFLKISPRNSAVIGDWHNDISLFNTPAFKVAVANAIPELKRKADMVTTKTNNEDGVAEFLELVLKAKKDK
ncbi:MAG: HAD family hydrolase [Ignavibacteriaceae bacterium]